MNNKTANDIQVHEAILLMAKTRMLIKGSIGINSDESFYIELFFRKEDGSLTLISVKKESGVVYFMSINAGFKSFSINVKDDPIGVYEKIASMMGGISSNR